MDSLLSLFKWGECSSSLWIFVLFGVVIVIYYGIKKLGGENIIETDPFNEKLIHVPGLGDLSGWRISHLVLFFIIGFMFPGCDVLAITSGIVWEIFEEVMGKIIPPKHVRDRSDEGGSIEDLQDKDYKYNWWSGSVNDIWLNTVGFYLGKSMRYLMVPVQ